MSDLETPKTARKLPEFRKPEAAATPQKTFKSLALLGLMMGGVFLLIYLGMGWIAREDLSVAELYGRSLDGRRDSKRMASVEWARRLHLYESRGQERQMRLLAPDLTQSRRLAEVVRQEIGAPARAGVESPDSLYLGALVTVLGFSRSPDPAAEDLSGLFVSIRPREWTDVQIHVLLALSRLRAEPSQELRERLLRSLSEDDTSLRKTAVFAVGAVAQTPESREFFRKRLGELVHDPVSDVRWNAGFALARWGDAGAYPVLAELLGLAERVRADAHLQDGEVLTESLFLSLDQAFRLVARQGPAELAQKLSVIARESPHLKLRQAAISALKHAR